MHPNYLSIKNHAFFIYNVCKFEILAPKMIKLNDNFMRHYVECSCKNDN